MAHLLFFSLGAKLMPEKPRMKFWLRSILNIPGFPPQKRNEPFYVDPRTKQPATVASALYPTITYHGKPLEIMGEISIDDPKVILALMKNPGNLHFRAQDAVDLGMLSAEQVIAAGYPVVENKSVQKPQVVAEIKPEPSYDLDVMTKKELVEFIGKKKLTVDITQSKSELLKDVRKALG